MTKVAAGITTSLDGYITGPNDGRGRGLGDGGERLHYWAAEGMDVFILGGADVIRQALRAGHVGELSISIAPVVLGTGIRLFEGFEGRVTLEHQRLLQAAFATHTYRVS